MISVVVPIYNASEYLSQCIESILNQSVADIELILVDNGSTDNSLSICEKYATDDKRIRIYREERKGPFYARKRGVFQAAGEYISFVDSDDFVASNSYALALEDIEKGIDTIMFDIFRYFSSERVRYDSCCEFEGTYDEEKICEEIWPKLIWNQDRESFGVDPSLCNKLFRSELLRKVFEQIDEIDFHYGEDVAVFYPLMLNAKSVSIHKCAYYYHRQRGEGEIPSYFQNPDFLDNLYSLFVYLRKAMGNTVLFGSQIEQFYLRSMEWRRRLYCNEEKKREIFVFPFGKVAKDERIILYGAGNAGQQYMFQINETNYCNVVAWMDSFAKKDDVISLDKIDDYVFDKIVVSIRDEKIRHKVVEDLISRGVLVDQIVY